MQLRVFIFFISMTLLVTACKNEVAEPDDIGYDYFPLVQGHWISYQVDSVAHDNALGIHDHFNYQVKELVDSSFIDNEGETAYRMERYKRADETFPWTLSDVWTIKRNNSRAEKVEENVRTIRLAFPANEGLTWDYNAENINDFWESEILSAGDSYSIEGNEFADVCQVSIVDSPSLIEATIGEAVYARNVGLVYFRLDDVRFLGFVPDGTQWEDQDVSTGIEFEMRYLDHGVE